MSQAIPPTQKKPHINKLINNHGGLHNRLTNKILLHPFTLSECEQYSEANKLGLSRYQMVENYMIMGGIPFYWSLLKREISMAQNIDSLFFSEDTEGLLHEYEQLYSSLFNVLEIKQCKVIDKLIQCIFGVLSNTIIFPYEATPFKFIKISRMSIAGGQKLMRVKELTKLR